MEYLRYITNTSKEGTNFYYLSNAARTLGFDYRALKGDVRQLNKSMLPCIAHVIIDSKYKHFVVVNSVGRKYVSITDPAVGVKTISLEEFESISTNQFLILMPQKKIPIINSDNKLMNFIINILKDSRQLIVSLSIFSLIYTFLNILISYGFQFVIEDAINVLSINNLYFLLFLLVFFSLIKHIVDYFRNRILNYINYKMDFIVMSNTFKHIIALPYQYYKTKSTGDVVSRVTDLVNIKESFSNIIMYLFVDSILIILVFFCLIRINLSLTFVTVVILILYLVVIKLFSPFLQRKVLNLQELNSKVNLSLIESLESVETIKGLNLEDNFYNKFNDTYHTLINNNYKFLNFYNVEDLLKNLIDGLGIIIIIFVGGLMVIKGKMTVAQIITYNSLMIYFLEPLKNIIDSDIQIKRASSSLRRVNDLLSIDSEDLKLDNKLTNKPIEGNISINNLSYSYNGRNNIIDDVSINISKGDRVMICGASGSGKSTLMKIIMKYYDVENNLVKIDDKDINDYNLIDLRRDICYISQNEKILTDSVYNNIVLDRNISYDEFLKVCKLLIVDDIVQNNICKYDMLLEEGGFNISGGERQRIVMARALLKESSIYIFDESLSQVDIESERKILKSVFKYLSNKTIIFVSHRFDNKDLFSKTLRIEGGKICD